MNDGIPVDSYEGEPYKCRLPSIWDFLATVRAIRVDDVVLAKADFSRDYRQIPVDPRDWLKQLFFLPQSGFMLDTRAIFGGRTCASMMQRTHQALAWAGINTSVAIDQTQLSLSSNPDHAAHRSCALYIDDALVAVHRACASSTWTNLLAVFTAANIQLSTTEGHVSPPSRSLRALGFDINLDQGTVAIPPHKMAEMLEFANLVLS